MTNKGKVNKSKRKRGKKFRFFVENVKADAKGEQENPFENHFRNKAHKKAQDVRIELVQEYKNRGKTGGINDRRLIGDKGGGEMERFAIERSRNKRKMRFELDSDEEDLQKIQLTHGGKALDETFDFRDDKDLKNRDNGEDRYKLDDKIVKNFHFGGNTIDKDDNEDDFFKVKKTKEEVFKEIVTKSKIFKAAKAELRDQNEELIDKLDDDFGDIFPLLETKAKMIKEGKPRPKEGEKVSLLEVSKKQNDKEIQKKSDMRKRDQKHIRKADMNTDYNYDSLAVTLRDSKKARPNRPVQTVKEKALDRKSELEKLQKKMEENDKNVNRLENIDEVEDREDFNDPEKMNNALVDLIENEYNDKTHQKPDEFEAIEEHSSDSD
ncbi:unnamed protein product [Moneuplotes crassus]|uniref:Nucleolar protein 14 n=2 Tax=Euplotes crassus TaxID=5936 RepID=A0AAD1UIY9_EUPCR|nr:unnamed protein product [Moneuplotes crassus]